MPNTKSAMKAMRQSKRRREINLKVKDNVKETVKNVRKLITAGKKDEAAQAMRKAMSALDKAVKKGVLPKNTSSRRKAKLSRALAK